MQPSLARQNAILLGLCQFCYMAATATGISFSGLVGMRLASDAAWATLPYLLITACTALLTLAMGPLISRTGYRATFVLGVLAGAVGGLVSVLALWWSSFALFCLGAPLQGFYQATALYYRYAAAEGAAGQDKGTAMAWVLSGGILAALVGPWLAGSTLDALPQVRYGGSFIGVAVVASLSLLPLALARLPRPAAPTADPQAAAGVRPKLTPQAWGGLFACAGGYALMMFMMVASPLAIAACGFTPVHAASVIQWHMLGMFAPSLVTGRLIGRWGAVPVALAGSALYLAAAALALAGLTLNHFHISLLLVGLGWNLLYMSGSTLIAQSPAPLRQRLLPLNEFLTFGAVAVAAGVAGWLHQTLGWQAVALSTLGLTLGLTLAAWLLWRRAVVQS
ncbi:MFS transporter [Chitiniphilus purpureus]|uniref:MFS transporter n=1 Tax=Chitiniphilus purpureus TaxID=2981137 RepID=A0ABY6DMM8_9NEIS|nr:MFS transporter [Chitiniphilus sp. CD1]UXY14948.1 MFS transporter [Chitiniphilus sp. CD1]